MRRFASDLLRKLLEFFESFSDPLQEFLVLVVQVASGIVQHVDQFRGVGLRCFDVFTQLRAETEMRNLELTALGVKGASNFFRVTHLWCTKDDKENC